MIIETFEPYHIDLLRAQGLQAEQREIGALVYAHLAKPVGPAFTVRAPSGDVLLCGGIAYTAPHMGTCWALLSESSRRYLKGLHREVKRFLDLYAMQRLETTVREGFLPGCKWVEKLGFEFEGRMAGYGERGETHLRFSKVRL
jgi:hypothetical protein